MFEQIVYNNLTRRQGRTMFQVRAGGYVFKPTKASVT